uniref:Uncharacterized protein n=1 Tax=Meloidogyne incognita TaxID=6306 RepID=A0A914L6P9_MELIC
MMAALGPFMGFPTSAFYAGIPSTGNQLAHHAQSLMYGHYGNTSYGQQQQQMQQMMMAVARRTPITNSNNITIILEDANKHKQIYLQI